MNNFRESHRSVLPLQYDYFTRSTCDVPPIFHPSFSRTSAPRGSGCRERFNNGQAPFCTRKAEAPYRAKLDEMSRIIGR